MADTSHDHEIVSIYGFSQKQINKLLEETSECVLMWATRDGWPVGVIHSFFWKDERLWITFAAHRHRAAAIKRDPRVSVTVSSASAFTADCPQGSVTVKGRGIIHDDQATKDWFYSALAHKGRTAEQAEHFISILDSPLRVILEVVPEKWITFDADKSARDMAGKLLEEEKTPRQSADEVRMNKERERRGLPPR